MEIVTNIFILAGIQGLLLSVLLFSKKENHTANVILSFGMFLISIDLFSVVYYARGWMYDYPHLMGISYAFPFLYGPIFYIYTLLISQNKKFIKKYLIHFLPFIFITIYSLPVYLMSGTDKIAFVELLNSDKPLFYFIVDELKSVHGIIYTVFTILLVKKHNDKLKQKFSYIEKINLNWLRYLVFALTIIWSLSAASFIIDLFTIEKSNSNDFTYLGVSVLIYAIGYLGLKQPEIFSQNARIDETAEEEKESILNEKYSKSGLDETSAQEYLSKLEEKMISEKYYLIQELTLRELAEKVDISTHNLSEVLNTKLNKNFYDYINEFRVEEVKSRLLDPEYENLNILAIALDCGFKSKTSFNNIFKKFTSMTPTEYKRSKNK